MRHLRQIFFGVLSFLVAFQAANGDELAPKRIQNRQETALESERELLPADTPGIGPTDNAEGKRSAPVYSVSAPAEDGEFTTPVQPADRLKSLEEQVQQLSRKLESASAPKPVEKKKDSYPTLKVTGFTQLD